VPGCKKIINNWLNTVWHRMLYSCTNTATVGVKGLTLIDFDGRAYNTLTQQRGRVMKLISHQS